MIYCGNEKTHVGAELQGINSNTVAEIRKRRVVEAHSAAFQGSLYYLKTLMDDGEIDPNEIPDGKSATIFMAAARSRDWEKVQYLVRRGARVSECGRNGVTPLACAAVSGSPEVTWILLKNGAKVNMPDGKGRTELIHAVKAGYPEVVEMLLNAGSDPNAKGDCGCTVEQFARAGQLDFNECVRKLEDQIYEGRSDEGYYEFLTGDAGPNYKFVLRLLKKFRKQRKAAA